ncbi:2-C-methyl-D-erythritol 4-phosphate cytidylyltransferase [Thalassotalea psychrophila]|uniref:2-C-methyl-D-erythritol 4-phosphate cytidylyltransferase n=1 Tax=Thalassotalea psychrophila TaxID=3065647 RepID=A0ABY9TRN5_9GAMM|nr:2-C-methyl-D-erythritol 4-phosphate cytidylyltransferase [Colwelliaceae bacterium SQ149]
MNINTDSLYVVLPAAGIGKRMSKNIPKQYLKINGRCIIEHTIERLLSHPRIGQVIVALAEHDSMFSTLDISKNSQVSTVLGGNERSDSVLAGLKAMHEQTWVLVHDAARPCLTHEDIDALIHFCFKHDTGAILATPVRDTMKRSQTNQQIKSTENRNNLWHAQTPQMFKHQQLTRSIELALQSGVEITDEASAMEFANVDSFIVSGREDNIKITRPSDLNLAAFILTQQKEETCA